MSSLGRSSVAFALGLAAALAATTGCANPTRDGVEERFNFWPFAYYDTSDEPPGHSVDVLWPLIHRQVAGDARSSRALPFYVHQDDGQGETFLNVLALYWQRNDTQRSAWEKTLFPLLFLTRSPDEINTHVWPLYGVKRHGPSDARSRSDVVAYPLFEYDRRTDGTQGEVGVLDFAPVFTLFGRERQAPAPDAGHTISSRRTEFFVVLDEVLKVYSSHEAPTYYEPDQATRQGGRKVLSLLDSFAVFDQKWRAGQRSEWSLIGFPPLDGIALARSRTDAGGDNEGPSHSSHLFPFYFHRRSDESSSRWLLPLFGHRTGADGDRRTWIVPPLLGLESDPSTSTRGFDVLWPLVRHVTSGTGAERTAHTRALPFFWLERQASAKTRFIFPLYYEVENDDSRFLLVLPFFGRYERHGGDVSGRYVVPPVYMSERDRRSNLKRTDLLWPLASFETSNAGTTNRVFPLFYYRAREARTHLNLLLLFDRDESEVRSSTLVYPLYSSIQAAGEGQRRSWLPLLDWRLVSDPVPRGDATSLLFPFANFWRGEGDATSRWVFPFYWWLDDGAGTVHRHFWPLFGLDVDDGITTWSTLFPLFYRGADADGERTRTGFLFPLGGGRSTADSSVSWFVPPIYYRSTEMAEHDGVTRRTGSTRVLWPLFSHRVEDDGRRRWHSLFYLLRSERSADGEQRDFSVLGALFKSRHEGARYTQSVPFLYHYENDDVGQRTLRLFHLLPIRF